MPYKSKHPCSQQGCPELVDAGKKYCEKHLPLHPEYTRPANKRGYGSRWNKARKLFLQEHPFCVHCLKEDPPKYVKATDVDHIIPHRGDQKLFWDKKNWQALCHSCHSKKTAREDLYPEYHF